MKTRKVIFAALFAGCCSLMLAVGCKKSDGSGYPGPHPYDSTAHGGTHTPDTTLPSPHPQPADSTGHGTDSTVHPPYPQPADSTGHGSGGVDSTGAH